MASENDYPQNDDVSVMLDNLYEQIMMRRLEYIEARKDKGATSEEKERKSIEQDDKLSQLKNLESDFNDMLKTHTAYWKFKKATGQIKVEHSDKLREQIKKMQTNMGSIISSIPKS